MLINISLHKYQWWKRPYGFSFCNFLSFLSLCSGGNDWQTNPLINILLSHRGCLPSEQTNAREFFFHFRPTPTFTASQCLSRMMLISKTPRMKERRIVETQHRHMLFMYLLNKELVFALPFYSWSCSDLSSLCCHIIFKSFIKRYDDLLS